MFTRLSRTLAFRNNSFIRKASSTSNNSSKPTNNVKGMLTIKELENLVGSGKIDTVCIAFTDHHGRFLGKRFDAEYFLTHGVDGTHACTYLLTIDIEQGIHPGFEYASWETGYGDFHMAPDWSTLRVAAWLDRTAYVQCDVVDMKTHELVPLAPRSMLKKQIERAKQHKFLPIAATELEYYIYKTSFEEANSKGYREEKLQPYGYYLGDYNMLQSTREEPFNSKIRSYFKESGIKVENSKGEYGHGQHELNIVYDEVLKMADTHAIYKQCFKEAAMKMGQSVTFMAKPHANQSGSSCHVHMSLWDENRTTNIFNGKNDLDGVNSSDSFKHFLGGWIKHTPEIMVFLAPTINSYKRYVSGSWAPTRLGWSIDNRTAGFRIVGAEGGPGLRIECRIPGADCNPYLALTGLLAAGLEGIEKKIEPPTKISGDMYNNRDVPSVPSTLADAVKVFENSKFAKDTFGSVAHKHYTTSYKTEVECYNRAVTDWERKRYFEQI